jgi:hypothetical protein
MGIGAGDRPALVAGIVNGQAVLTRNLPALNHLLTIPEQRKEAAAREVCDARRSPISVTGRP